MPEIKMSEIPRLPIKELNFKLPENVCSYRWLSYKKEIEQIILDNLLPKDFPLEEYGDFNIAVDYNKCLYQIKFSELCEIVLGEAAKRMAKEVV